MPRPAEDLFVVGLLACLLGVLALGAVFVAGIRRRQTHLGISSTPPCRLGITTVADCPLRERVFGGMTCRWLAIRPASMAAVSAAESEVRRFDAGDETTPGPADTGLHSWEYSNRWRIMVGPSLPDPAEDVDRCYQFVRDLSCRVGWVQFFSLDRILGDHAWVVAHGGRIIRAYAWVAGQVVWNQGIQTAAERELGVTCLDYCEACTRADATSTPDPSDNVEKVLLLAAAWGVHPLADTN